MSASSGFGSYQAAKSVVDAVVSKSVAESEKINPPAKTAVVTEINFEERWCMVIYTGDVDAVKVPFTSIAPGYEGQTVKIGGPVSDRHIIEVIGPSDAEDRIRLLEEALSPAYGEVYNANEVTTPTGAQWSNVPLLDIRIAPLDCELINGVIRILNAGVYEVAAHGASALLRDGQVFNVRTAFSLAGTVTTIGRNDSRFTISGGGGEGGSNASGTLERQFGLVNLVNLDVGSLVSLQGYGTDATGGIFPQPARGSTFRLGTTLSAKKIAPYQAGV